MLKYLLFVWLVLLLYPITCQRSNAFKRKLADCQPLMMVIWGFGDVAFLWIELQKNSINYLCHRTLLGIDSIVS